VAGPVLLTQADIRELQLAKGAIASGFKLLLKRLGARAEDLKSDSPGWGFRQLCAMPHPQIKFGTDGWRAVIADDFTFANVRIAAEAIAAYVHAKEDPAKGLCIGYDTRFGSKAFARACAEVVAATGIPVMLANASRPPRRSATACASARRAGGIMITSSHNPAQWNGVKYKAGTAAPASPR
jgi:phosphomannomutase